MLTYRPLFHRVVVRSYLQGIDSKPYCCTGLEHLVSPLQLVFVRKGREDIPAPLADTNRTNPAAAEIVAAALV